MSLSDELLDCMVSGKRYGVPTIASRLEVSQEEAKAALERLVALGKVKRTDEAGRHARYVKPCKQRRTAVIDEAQLQRDIINVMGSESWFQKDVAVAINRGRNIVRTMMQSMHQRGLLKRVHFKHQFYLYSVVYQAGADWKPECEDAEALRQLVAQQWRGSWLQGMEAVL